MTFALSYREPFVTALRGKTLHETFTRVQCVFHAAPLSCAAMIDVPRLVVFELSSAGARLWSSVRCDRFAGRWVVYADLRPERDAAEPAFAESARIIRRVLDNRLSARDWIAAVLCGARVSFTVKPD